MLQPSLVKVFSARKRFSHTQKRCTSYKMHAPRTMSLQKMPQSSDCPKNIQLKRRYNFSKHLSVRLYIDVKGSPNSVQRFILRIIGRGSLDVRHIMHLYWVASGPMNFHQRAQNAVILMRFDGSKFSSSMTAQQSSRKRYSQSDHPQNQDSDCSQEQYNDTDAAVVQVETPFTSRHKHPATEYR